MTYSLEKIEERIARRKEALQREQTRAREKRRRYAERRCRDLGRLVVKTGLDQLDSDAMLGAFLSVSAAMDDPGAVAEWRRLARKHTLNDQPTDGSGHSLAIAFDQQPSDEIRRTLKQRGFKWNAFRKEWQGSGHAEELTQVLGDSNPKIEII